MQINFSKTHLFVAILSLVLLYAFSFGPMMGMELNKHGQMSVCPFSMVTSICTMSFSEHLNLWQSTFTAISDNNVGLSVALGLIIFAASLALKLKEDRDKESMAYKFYTHEHQKSSTFNKLIELFSKGILNPKIYESAVL